MENNSIKNEPSTTVVEEIAITESTKPKHKNKGVLIGMIVLAILAIGGISFGVWAMLTKNQETESLNDQINLLKQQNIETIDELDEAITDENIAFSTNTANYIYIGEWGIKIRIPEKFSYLSYKFDYRAGEVGEFLYINAVEGDTQNIPSFINTSTNDSWLVAIARYPSGNIPTHETREPAYSSDGYSYFATGPQAAMSTNEADVELEVKTVNSLMDSLKNQENYSKI